jgi:hypothetical protein
MSVVSSTNTSVSVVASARSQVAGGSLFTSFVAHSTHVPMNLLVGRVSGSTTGGVGGSGSGSGRSHAANRAKAESATMQSTQKNRPPILFFRVFLFSIVVNFKGYDLIWRKYDFL